ncbi:MAG: NAD-dependent epimerase/dehydratase family protein [Planctomycetes bacterium]|nr:NAD-dependent epimerase/dehydratase family protein [Planctomycetota bacterium]
MADTPTVLVTGAAGFIGSHLCDALLAEGKRVRGVDRHELEDCANLQGALTHANFEYVSRDLGQEAEGLCMGVDSVCHLAAMSSVPDSITDPRRCHTDTCTSTLNVLQAARKAGVKRFVLSSSASVYGTTLEAPVVESVPTAPLSPYAAAKAAAEQYVRAFARMGVDGVSLRYFNVYGPRQERGVIPAMIRAFNAGRPVTMFGDGNQSRDFLYVADAVAANLHALRHQRPLGGEAFNVGCGHAITIRELAVQVGRVADKQPAFEQQPAREGDIRYSCADVTHAKRVLGFEATVRLPQGLRITMGLA